MTSKRIEIEKYCAVCARQFAEEDEHLICPDDGGFLVPFSADPLIGTVVANQFEIIDLLGAGGWGAVYKARDTKLSRLVALKILRADLASTVEKLKRFEREARMMSALNHPNICSVYDYGILENGQPYLVLEYLQGKTLEQLVDEEGPLPAQRLVPLIRQTAAALSAAHLQDIVHRDLKPGNIMVIGGAPSASSNVSGGNKDSRSESVARGETVKLIDFGLAKTYEALLAEQLTRTGMTLGTPTYMSPEQVRGLPLDGRSDIYSLGCVMFKCLTGRLPVTGDTIFEIMQNHLIKHVSKADFHDDSLPVPVPEQIKGLTLSCLATDAADRYQSMQDLQRDLSEFEQHGKFKHRERPKALRKPLSKASPNSSNDGLSKPSMYGRKTVITLAALSLCAAAAGFLYVQTTSGEPSFQSQMQQVEALAKSETSDDKAKTFEAGDKLIARLRKEKKEYSPEMVQVSHFLRELAQKSNKGASGIKYAQDELDARKHQAPAGSTEYINAVSDAASAVIRLDERRSVPYLQEVVSLTEKKYGADSKELCDPVGRLAWTLFAIGQHRDSIEQYERLIQLVKQHCTPRDNQYVSAHGAFAWVLFNAQQYERARGYSNEAVKHQSSTISGRDRVNQLTCAAQIAQKCGDYDQAIALFNQAYDVIKPIDALWGDTVIKGELGRCLFSAGRYKKAEPVLREALRNMEKTEYTEACYRLCLADYIELLRKTDRASEAAQIEAFGKI